MKKIILHIVVFISFAVSAYAQTPQYSKNLSFDCNSIIYQGSEADTNYFMYFNTSIISLKTVDLGLLNMSKKTNKLNSSSIAPTYKNKQLRFISSLRIDGRRVVFAAFWNQKHQKDYLFIQYQNTNGEQSQWRKILETFQNDKPQSGFYSLRLSPNKKKLLVVSRINNPGEGGLLSINVNIFDTDFNNIYSNKTSIGGRSIQTFADQIIIDNNGEIYLKVTENTELKRISGIYIYKKKFSIIHFSRNDSSVNTLPVLMEGKYITSFSIKLSEQNKLYIGGYYSNLGFATIQGHFISTLQNGKLQLLNKASFSEAIFEKYQPISTIRKEYPHEICAFTAQNLEIDSLGSVYIIGELISNYTNYLVSNTNAPYYSLQDNAFYDYRDILIIKHQHNGSIREQIISKNQRGFPWTNMSFCYSFDGSKFVFAFNSNKAKNLGVAYSKKGNTKFVSMDSDCKILGEEEIAGMSACNPLVFRPMSFRGPIYILNHDMEKDKYRIIKYGTL